MKFKFLGKLTGSGDEEEDKEDLVEKIRNLSDNGYSQHEITEELRDQGYAYAEINQAMNKVIKSSATGGGPGRQGRPQPPRGMEEGMGESERPPAPGQQAMPEEGPGMPQQEDRTPMDYEEEGGQAPAQQPQGPGPQRPAPQQQRMPKQPQEADESEDEWTPNVGIGSDEEALIETIVEEKLVDIEDEFENTYKEIDELREKLEKLEDRVHDIETRKEEDEKEFIQRVSDIEEYMEDSHSRIGGLEKAFQQTLPSLVENVRNLTDLVKGIKEEKESLKTRSL